MKWCAIFCNCFKIWHLKYQLTWLGLPLPFSHFFDLTAKPVISVSDSARSGQCLILSASLFFLPLCWRLPFCWLWFQPCPPWPSLCLITQGIKTITVCRALWVSSWDLHLRGNVCVCVCLLPLGTALWSVYTDQIEALNTETTGQTNSSPLTWDREG